MMTKKYTEISRTARHLPDLAKVLCKTLIVISMLFAISLLPICASGDDNSIIVENYNLIDKHHLSLGEDINGYIALDTSDGLRVSKGVTTVINKYRKDLLDLQEHKDVQSRLLEGEADAILAKGQVGGRIAWIYHYNLPRIKSKENQLAFGRAYDELLLEVECSKDSRVLQARGEAMCDELNRLAYKIFIGELADEGDSLLASSIIVGGVERVQTLYCADIFGKAYDDQLAFIKAELDMQRGRDKAERTIRDLYPIVLPDGDIAKDSSVALFIYKLKNSTSAMQVNAAMREVVSLLTHREQEEYYSSLFVEKILQAIDDATKKADEAGTVADILPIFADYTQKSRTASLKDEIRRTLTPAEGESEEKAALLDKTEKYFNADGGEVEQVTHAENFDTLRQKADCARRIIDELFICRANIEIILGPHKNEALLARTGVVSESALEQTREISSKESDVAKHCEKIVEELLKALGEIEDQSRAQRYLEDHRTILTKPRESLKINDELALRSAISDYLAITKGGAELLKSQIENIVEKYNLFIKLKMRSIGNTDMFYLELCEIFCKEAENLGTEDIAVFYNRIDLLPKKASTLWDCVEYYRTLLANAPSLNTDEQKELSQICTDCARSLGERSTLDTHSFEEDLVQILRASRLKMDALHQIARVRIAAKGSQNPKIIEITGGIAAKVRACYTKEEMLAIAEREIFKIERELAIDEMRECSELAKFEIESMKFLPANEKATLCAELMRVSNAACSAASLAESSVVLDFIKSNFSDEHADICKGANEGDLISAQKKYAAQRESEMAALKEKVSSLLHLPQKRRDDFYNSALSAADTLSLECTSAKTSGEVVELFAIFLQTIRSIELSASAEDLAQYREIIAISMRSLLEKKSDYSVENYNKLARLVDEHLTLLQGSGSIRDCNALLDTLRQKAKEIKNLLHSAISDATATLSSFLSACKGEPAQYSKSALAELEQLYLAAKTELEGLREMGELYRVEQILSAYLERMRGVNLSTLYTPTHIGRLAQDYHYPENYNFSKGYVGSVVRADGISSDAVFTIYEASECDVNSVQRLIQNAFKSGNFTLYHENSPADLSALKRCDVSLCLDLLFSGRSSESGEYRVKMALPSALSGEKILGVVFLDKDNNVEFYNAERQGNLISFDVSHFSRYYIVTENTINLYPLLAFLTAFLLVEIVVLLLLFVIYRKRNLKALRRRHLLLSLSPLPLYALQIPVQYGVGIAVLLSIAILSLGCAIAFLARLLLLTKKKASCAHSNALCGKKYHSPSLSAPPTSPALPVECDASLCTQEDTPSPAERAIIEDMNLSDPEKAPPRPARTCTNYVLKAEINLDTIAASFSSDILITPELLKEHSLIDQNAGYVKILARGGLEKPLRISAHDFSRSAEQILKSVGGEAIRIK